MSIGPLTRFAHRRSCMDFRSWLAAWWDSAPWRIPPQEPFDRCCMGGPVGDSVHCRRRITTGMWCGHHQSKVAS